MLVAAQIMLIRRSYHTEVANVMTHTMTCSYYLKMMCACATQGVVLRFPLSNLLQPSSQLSA